MKKLLSTIFFLFFAFSVVDVQAATTPDCQILYGSPDSCIQSETIAINKTIQAPRSINLVNRVGPDDEKFTIGQNIIFQIEIANTSTKELKDIKIQDLFPQGIDFVSGTGTFNASTQTLSISVSSLAAKDTKSYTIVARITESINLATDLGCRVNQAQVTVGDAISRDNVLFCIQKANGRQNGAFPGQAQVSPTPAQTKGGLPVYTSPKNISKTPPTGPEMLSLVALLPTGLAGLLLRRKASK